MMGEFARTPCHMLHDVGFVPSLNLMGGCYTAEDVVGTDVPSNCSYQDPVPWAAPVPGWRGCIKTIPGSCHATMLTWVSSTVSSPLLQCQTLGREATCPTLECRASDSENCMVSLWKDHLWG